MLASEVPMAVCCVVCIAADVRPFVRYVFIIMIMRIEAEIHDRQSVVEW